MPNQPTPPFPFDAFDAPFDSSEFDPAELFPPMPAIASDQRDALREVQRHLRGLETQLRDVLAAVDRAVHAAPPVSSSLAPTAPRGVAEPPRAMPAPRPVDPLPSSLLREDASVRTIEGVFDGQHMVGPDGKQYSVPANYSSKSKLVEGDILKLRITGRGAFVYKQIGPIARERRVGILERDDVSGEFVVLVPDAEEERSALQRAIVSREDLPTSAFKRYRIIRASVTYYKGEAGDEVVLLVPKDAPSTWAAVENIIKR